MRCPVDVDSPDSAMRTLEGIAAAAQRIAAHGNASGTASDVLDLKVVEILAADPYAMQDAAEKLVRDALQD
jgi:hypothetical protein